MMHAVDYGIVDVDTVVLTVPSLHCCTRYLLYVQYLDTDMYDDTNTVLCCIIITHCHHQKVDIGYWYVPGILVRTRTVPPASYIPIPVLSVCNVLVL